MRLSALTIGLVIVHGRWQRLAIASSYHRTRSAPFFISMACAVDLSKRDWKSAYPLAPAATCYFLDAPFPLVLLPPSQVRQSMNEGGYMRKKKHRVFAIAALAIIILALHPLVGLVFGDASATQPASYSFISLDIPNSSGELGFTSLADINNDGEITGGFTNSSGFGFLIGKTFSSTDIQCPGSLNPAVPNAQPQSINKHGEITGFCFTGGRLHGFLRDRKGKYTVLDFPRANLTEATGINDDGQVVGDYRDSNGRFHGFFWDAGLFLTIDVPFPGVTGTAGRGINNVGQIVGVYNDSSGIPHGFLYKNGIFTSLDFPGAIATFPDDINDRGQIVGSYIDSDFVTNSFLFEDGVFTTFDVTFSDAIFNQVNGINNQGQIVGRYGVINPGDPVNPFLNHGFIATPEKIIKGKPQLLVSTRNNLSNLKRRIQSIEELSNRLSKSAERM
jgi:probable HAF family extracellular repeat protein